MKHKSEGPFKDITRRDDYFLPLLLPQKEKKKYSIYFMLRILHFTSVFLYYGSPCFMLFPTQDFVTLL